MMRRTVLSIGLTFVFATTNAFAYCPTTTCAQDDPKPAECDPGVWVDNCQKSGKELFWKNPCGSFSVSVEGSPKLGITADQLETVGRKAFDNWLNVDCPDGGHPGFRMETYPQVECSEVRYNKKARNQNVWVFRDEVGSLDPTVIGLTSVIFEPNSGEIYDTDMEFNSAHFTFGVGKIKGEYSLQAVAQHESGHVLGLAHSDVADSTMLTNYRANSDTNALAPDDIEGICYVHPPTGYISSDCNADPRHGFSTQCNEPMAEAGCSCSVVGRSTQGSRGILLLLGLVTAFGRLKRKTR
jgi:MYXO-CTERM domain-containing protein